MRGSLSADLIPNYAFSFIFFWQGLLPL